MRNIRLTLAYDGTDYFGWQRQPERPTIQGAIEGTIERILGEPATVWASGRTDAGVHAANQVVNFKTSCPIPCPNLLKALNDLLPVSVRIKEAAEVPLDFHARYGAVSKTYRYRILLAPVASPFMARYAWHHPQTLDQKAMARAARQFEGRYDFTSFAAVGEKVEEREDSNAKREIRGMTRTVYSSQLLRHAKSSILVYEVRGNGFLHHMVRNIVGTLVEVGRGKTQPAEISRILEAKDRKSAGPTAPAHGLCLWKVEYRA